jgi:hypothetical protein
METARERGRYGHRDATMILIYTGMGCGQRSCVRYTKLSPERFKSFWAD